MKLRSAPSQDWIAVGFAVAIPMGALLGSFGAHLLGSPRWVGAALGALRGAVCFGTLCALLVALDRLAWPRMARSVRVVLAVLMTTLLVAPIELIHDFVIHEMPFSSLVADSLPEILAAKAAQLLWPVSLFAIAALAPRWMRMRQDDSEVLSMPMPSASQLPSSPLDEDARPEPPAQKPAAEVPVEPLRAESAAGDLEASVAPEILEDVLAAEAEAHYVALTMESGRRLLVHGRFSDALCELSALPGLQVHRSHWVADRAVKGLTEGRTGVRLRLLNGAEVPVSRRFAAPALRRYRPLDSARADAV